jgi:sortase A
MRRRPLLWFGCALLAGGALALFWYAHFQFEIFRTQRETKRFLANSKQRAHEPKQSPRTIVIVPPRPGEPVGRIEIPRIHFSEAILEGTSPKILKIAAGHIHGTALPGMVGNTCIAGHRDSVFRSLRDVRPLDSIVLTTPYGTFKYVIDSTEVVDPNNVAVLQKTSDAQLTLVTCFPFTFVGSAPKRFVVHAHQQSSSGD